MSTASRWRLAPLTSYDLAVLDQGRAASASWGLGASIYGGGQAPGQLDALWGALWIEPDGDASEGGGSPQPEVARWVVGERARSPQELARSCPAWQLVVMRAVILPGLKASGQAWALRWPWACPPGASLWAWSQQVCWGAAQDQALVQALALGFRPGADGAWLQLSQGA